MLKHTMALIVFLYTSLAHANVNFHKSALLVLMLLPSVDFRNIYLGSGEKCNITTKRTIVMYTQDELKRVWGLAFGIEEPTPVADFDSGMVLAVFAGSQDQYIKVEGIEFRDGELIVKVAKFGKAKGCPYQFIWVSKVVEAKKIITEGI